MNISWFDPTDGQGDQLNAKLSSTGEALAGMIRKKRNKTHRDVAEECWLFFNYERGGEGVLQLAVAPALAQRAPGSRGAVCGTFPWEFFPWPLWKGICFFGAREGNRALCDDGVKI